MFNSGSRMYFFIGINCIVFVALGILNVIEFLFTRSTPLSYWISENLALPAYLPSLMYKPWALATYMFTHAGFFHFFFNMLWLYWMGRIFEDFLNPCQFTFNYLAGGLTGGILYIISYNIFPGLKDNLIGAEMVGSSASVMAIAVATATLLPDYSIRLLFLGDVKLKFLIIAYVLLDVIGIAQLNAGGSIAHLGGALLGFIYIKQLQNGNDWSKLFQKRKRLRVIKNTAAGSRSANTFPPEEVIDQILDKISRSGYDSLSKQEKEQLFKASKKDEK